MKIAVPDALLGHEREMLRSLLTQRGHHVVFEAIPSDTEVLLTGGPGLGYVELHGLDRLLAVFRFARGRHDLSSEREYCKSRGLVYRRISGGSTNAAAEHALMLILGLLRNLGEAHASMITGQWELERIAELGIRDLEGRTIGLIGLGRVGHRVARLIGAFGAYVLYFKPTRLARPVERQLGVHWTDLETLLRNADVICLLARTPSAGTPILTRERVALLKAGAVLVNVGDGRHVDQEAMWERVRGGSLRVGLDVFEEEPFVVSPDLASTCAGSLLTPHIAGRSRDAARHRFRAVGAAVDPFEHVAAGTACLSAETTAAASALETVLCILGPPKPLEGCAAERPRGLIGRLPGICEALEAIGCVCDASNIGGDPLLVVTTPLNPIELAVVVPGVFARAGETAFSTASIPAVSFLLERWVLDHALWDWILPRGAEGSLPGRTIVVNGYDRAGQLIAWRASGMGMHVLVRESDPQRLLDALYNGFETISPHIEVGDLALRQGALEVPADLLSLAPSDGIPRGMADEMAAVCLIALFVLRETGQRDQRQWTENRVIRVCNRLVLDALCATRTENYEWNPDLWNPDSW